MIQQHIVENVILIFAVGALVGFFAPEGDRAWWGIFATWAAFCLSLLVWVIFVAAHFIGMYW